MNVRAWVWAGLGLIVACGAGGDGGSRPPGAPDSGAAPPAADASVPSPDDSGLPPEVEETRDFETPRAGARHVFVANPLRDTVAVIDSETLRIESVEAGDGPTYLETVPGQDRAVVLNVGSRDATVIRSGEGASTTSTVDVVAGSNAIAIAPDGRHAVVYFDATRPGAGVGSGSFQDVTVVTMHDAGDSALDISVGFRPSRVIFQPDSSAAFLVTEDGISVLRFSELTGPTIVPTVSVGDTPSDPLSRDVSITADGRYALARREGSRVVRLIELSTGEVLSLDLGGPVTDLDVVPDGTSALAVVRQTGTFVRLALPGAFVDGSGIEEAVVEGQTIGSVTVSASGDYAMLYTTAAPIERASIVELATGLVRTIRLRKSIRSVAMSPTGGAALIVHTQETGARSVPPPAAPADPDGGLGDADVGDGGLGDADVGDGGLEDGGLEDGAPPPPLPDFPRDPATEELEREIDASFGYSLVDLESGFAKLQLTDVDVGPLAMVPDGTHAFALFRDDATGVREVQRILLASFRVERTTLGSPPRSLGVVGDTARVFVGQEHPEGRITFIDWLTGDSEAVTGFELNSRIVE